MELVYVYNFNIVKTIPLITGCRWLDYFGCNWSWI